MRTPYKSVISSAFLCALITIPFVAGAVLAQPRPTSKTRVSATQNPGSQDENVPAPLRARVAGIRAQLKNSNLLRGSAGSVFDQKISRLIEDLVNASCHLTAGDLAFQWAVSGTGQVPLEKILLRYKRASDIFSGLANKQKLADISFNRASTFVNYRKFSEALEEFVLAEARFKELGDERGLAEIALNRGSLYVMLKSHEKAVNAYGQAERYYRKHGDQMMLAGIAQNRGIILQSLGRHEDALKNFDEAAVVFKKNDLTSQLASLEQNRGNALCRLGRFDKAIESLSFSVEVFRKAKASMALADALISRGSAYAQVSRYDQASKDLDRAEAISAQLGLAARLAKITHYRGNICYATARYDEALQLLEQASAAYRKLGGGGPMATIAQSRSSVYHAQSRYRESLAEIEGGLRLARKDGDKNLIVSLEANRAVVLRALGRHAESLKAYDSAIRGFKSGGDETSAATIMLNRGVVLEYLERFDEALEAYEQAAAIFDRNGDRERVAIAAVNRGSVYSVLGDQEKAIREFDGALAVFDEDHSPNQAAIVHANKAVSFKSLGRYKEALKEYEIAANVFRQHRDLRSLATILSSKGEVYSKLSEHEKALDCFFESVTIIDELLVSQVQGISEESSIGFRSYFENLPADCARAALLATEAGKRNSDNALWRRAVALSFKAMEVVQGRSILEGIIRGDLQVSSSLLKPSQRQQLRKIQLGRGDALKRMRVALSNKGNSPEASQIYGELEELDQQERRIVEAARLKSPVKAEAAFPHAVDYTELRESLSDGMALIQLAIQDRFAWGIVATRNELNLVELGDAKSISADLSNLHAALIAGSQILDTVALRRLSRAILDPVLSVLPRGEEGDVDTLVFSMKGQLARIPAEILLTEAPKDDSEKTPLPFLIRSFDVTYVPSATTFVAMMKRLKMTSPEKQGSESQLYALGMPLDVKAEAAEEGLVPHSSSEADPVSSDVGFNPSRNVLFGSKDEVLKIAELFADSDEKRVLRLAGEKIDDEELAETAEFKPLKGRRFKVLLRGSVDEAKIKNDPDLALATYIHFAGHGEADLRSPDLSRLVLAQSKRLQNRTGEDGLLYFRELARLQLSAEMLVLSACSTNQGTLYPTEGIMGLAQGGLLAGAKSVLSTIWRVDDENAQVLMFEFYRRLTGRKVPRAKALAQAKRHAIKLGVPIATWASYILWDAEIE